MTASTTIAKDLDRLSDEVLEVLVSTVPARSYAKAAPLLFSKYSLRVTPDNLRAWHIRRVAVEAAEVTPADVRCETDEYAEAIAVWREPERRLGWGTIARLLESSFGYVVKEQTLRSWWHRRKEAGLKSSAGVAAVTRGVELARAGLETVTVALPSASHAPALRSPPDSPSEAPSPDSAPVAAASVVLPSTPFSVTEPDEAPAAASGPRRLYSGDPENDVQRRIRERREAAARVSGRQDELLLRLVPGAEEPA
jgi:hypothetical protein